MSDVMKVVAIDRASLDAVHVVVTQESLVALLQERRGLRESLTMAQNRCGKLHEQNVAERRVAEAAIELVLVNSNNLNVPGELVAAVHELLLRRKETESCP